MIGDDIVDDVGGAQRCGMRAVQVRTGKYRSVHILQPALHGGIMERGGRTAGNGSAKSHCALIALQHMHFGEKTNSTLERGTRSK